MLAPFIFPDLASKEKISWKQVSRYKCGTLINMLAPFNISWFGKSRKKKLVENFQMEMFMLYSFMNALTLS